MNQVDVEQELRRFGLGAEDVDETFTAIAMSIVFFFLADPVKVLRECRRVLRPGGRLAIYPDEELAELGRAAELSDVTVENDRGGQLLVARKRSSP